MISTLSSLYPGINIFVTDGGSRDKTIDKVRLAMKTNKNLKYIINHTKLKGLTTDVMEAVHHIKTPWVVVMDSDFQHPPKKVGEIMKELVKGADIVIGTRHFLPKDWPWHRRLMSKVAAWLGKMRLHRKAPRDIMSGFFGANKRRFEEKIIEFAPRFVGEGYKVLYDLLKVWPSARVAEVEYTFGVRQRGYSKIGKKQIFAYLKSLAT